MNWLLACLFIASLLCLNAANSIKTNHEATNTKSIKTIKVKHDKSCAKDCTGNGICDKESGTCLCEPAFTGKDCSTNSCEHLSFCNENGVCRFGECNCFPGFEGDGCDKKIECENNCHDNGVCKNGKCYCNFGFTGASCKEELKCPDGCNNNGFCSFGVCTCLGGYGGDACQIPPSSIFKECSSDCGGSMRGECRHGECVCYPGYYGDDCSQDKECDSGCSGHGICSIHLDAICKCELGWDGSNCDVKVCPKSNEGVWNTCNGNGMCQSGKCFCDPNYTGETCDEEIQCENDCNSPNGICHYGKCYCFSSYAGSDCSKSTMELRQSALKNHCPNNCSYHGVCTHGMVNKDGKPMDTCTCLDGWSGTDCSQHSICESKNFCNGHGSCESNGKCICDCGYIGDSCSEMVITFDATCPNDCSGKGQCLMGQCYCDPGHTGDDCNGNTECPFKCNSRGVCKWGKCFCEPGFYGVSCEEESGCNGCSGNGSCCNGQCYCESGFVGAQCAVSTYGSMTCLNHCSAQGTCEVYNGSVQCKCNEGFSGIDCSHYDHFHESATSDTTTLIPPGATSDTRKDNSPNFKESMAEIKTREMVDPCENETCNQNGICAHDGKCFCYPGFEGGACDKEIECENNCHDQGVCTYGKCFCSFGFTGQDCGVSVQESFPTNTCESNNECNSLFGECNQEDGVCHCFTNVIHPSCVTAKVEINDDKQKETSTNDCDSSCYPLNNITRINNYFGNNESSDSSANIYSSSSVVIILGSAFVGGLIVGLLIQVFTSMHQRSLARAIIEEDGDYVNNSFYDFRNSPDTFNDPDSLTRLNSTY